MAVTKSAALAAVLKTPDVPPGHLNEVGHVIVRPPVASWVMNQLMVCPSCGLLIVGATVTLAVKVVVNTLDNTQFTVIAVAENVTATGGVAALPDTVRELPSNVRFAD